MNIWFVAFYFPPINIIGAERPKKILRHFAERRLDATVFTVDVPETDKVETFAGFPCQRSKVAYEDYHFRSSISRKQPSFLRRFIPRAITALLDDSGWTWMPSLRRDMEKAWSEGNRPDVIIATGRPFLTFLTVSRFARKHGIPFVLDYRDAWSRNPHPSYETWLRRKLLSWLEKRTNKQADGIVTVSHLTAEALNTDKSPVIIYNLPDQGYMDELKAYAPQVDLLSPDKLVLVYTGTLYPGRDLDPICAAIAKLDSAVRNQIEVHYCGNSSARAVAAFERHEIQDQLISHGSLSKSDATRLVASGDIALSIICSETETDNDALRGVITTKVFDYLLLDKDVLNIVPEGFEFRTFADEAGLEGLKNYTPEDIDSIAEFLREKLAAKGAEGARVNGDGTATMIAAWDAQMAKLDALLADKCGTK